MCARVFLNGNGLGENSHLSLFFVVMKGEYDTLLDWPFQQRIIFSLLDQEGSMKHLTDSFWFCSSSDMNIACGFPKFVAQNVVDSAPYYNSEDDCIFVEVSVNSDAMQVIDTSTPIRQVV